MGHVRWGGWGGSCRGGSGSCRGMVGWGVPCIAGVGHVGVGWGGVCHAGLG